MTEISDPSSLGSAERTASIEPSRNGRETGDAAAAEATRANGAASEGLAPLFPGKVAEDLRSRWDAIQIGFVDDPKLAVHQADELVAHIIKRLAESFSRERSDVDGHLNRNDGSSTENLRVALRRYRSFFHRLVTL